MSSHESPYRLVWSPEARADIRAIDQRTALEILKCLDRFLQTRQGDVKRLQPPLAGFRLRCGDYRLFFRFTADDYIQVTAVAHRRDAYR